MYWNVWVSISALRFALYGGISFFIYQARGSYMMSSYTSKMEPSGLEQLKSRVVFTYVFMEMMVWFWVCFPQLFAIFIWGESW
jgi:magnesium-transporting ATPase (P-type)